MHISPRVQRTASAEANAYSYSYVGNSITTFVLQLLGLEAGILNTVQFSNHAGYGRLKGFRTSAQQITDLFEGLKLTGQLEAFDMLLTGYVPGEQELEAVGTIAKEVKKTRRSCFWCEHPLSLLPAPWKCRANRWGSAGPCDGRPGKAICQ
jgi:pyridoxal kinase